MPLITPTRPWMVHIGIDLQPVLSIYATGFDTRIYYVARDNTVKMANDARLCLGQRDCPACDEVSRIKKEQRDG